MADRSDSPASHEAAMSPHASPHHEEVAEATPTEGALPRAKKPKRTKTKKRKAPTEGATVAPASGAAASAGAIGSDDAVEAAINRKQKKVKKKLKQQEKEKVSRSAS